MAAEFEGSGELAAAFRGIPDHAPATSRHNVNRMVRIPAEGGEIISTIRRVKIVEFRGRVPSLQTPDPNTQTEA